MTKRKKRQIRKRLTKAERAIAKAERLARLLAETPAASNAALAPPAFITDPRLATAFQFWKDHAAQLSALGTLENLDRFAFAILCIYAADFVEAQDDILAKGYSILVKTISGDRMPRENPSVWRRDFAAKMVTDLSKAFGLTKVDRLNLLRAERRFSDASDGELFANQPAASPKPERTDPQADPDKWDALLRPRSVN